MLILTRKKNESIVIGNEIRITVVEIRGAKVRLAIVAPREASVHRQEVWAALHHDMQEVRPAVPVHLDPAWLAWNDRTIPKLAEAIRDERAWERLPVLADALEDAGCTDEAILAHCRSGTIHAATCWVIDLVLAQ